jgi:hypothetical protein
LNIEMGDVTTDSRNFPFFLVLGWFRLVLDVWRRNLWKFEPQSSVLNVVVNECGKAAFDIRVWEMCNGICAETVAIGFHARNTLPSANSPFFLFV